MSEFYHHGILGMKWGVRRQKNRTESFSSERIPNENADVGLHNTISGRYSAGRKYAASTIAGAVGAMSVNIAAHALIRKKYKTGKEFVANMANSALFGASVGSLVASVRVVGDTNR